MIDYVLNFHTHLPEVIANFGTWAYAIIFLIIFCETGLVVMPFLPGDSMLFALGVFAAAGHLDIWILMAGMILAAILGDSLNYAIGKWVGKKMLMNPKQKFFKPEHYQKAHEFYEKYGAKAIILSRFLPVVRTFAPFIAGVSEMNYRRFLKYNVAGAFIWILVLTGGGYLLGNIPIVKNNITVIIMIIIVGSFLPVAWEIWKNMSKKKEKKEEPKEEVKIP